MNKAPLKERIMAPISKWVGAYFGFSQNIEDLLKITQRQSLEIGGLESKVEGMHAYYMGEYRRLESEVATVVKMALPELNFRMSHAIVNRGSFHFQECGHLMMGSGEMQSEARYSEVEQRTVVTSTINMGFAFDNYQPKNKPEMYPLAVAFAKKASEMAYDAVMRDCSQRPAPLFPSKQKG